MLKNHTWTKYRKVLICLVTLIGIFFLIPFSAIKDISYAKNAYFKVIPHEKGAKFYFTTLRPRYWVKLKDLDHKFYEAIRISEDWKFFDHQGVDLLEIGEALRSRFFDGKKLRGASTISQQVVKNLFTTGEKTFLRKAKELFLTIYLERELSKKQILEIYLNIAHLGPQVYGVGHAARYYFDRGPKLLGARHGSFLAMLLPSPQRYGQSFRDRKLTPFARGIMRSILTKMAVSGVIEKEMVPKYLEARFAWEKAESGARDGLLFLDEDEIEIFNEE